MTAATKNPYLLEKSFKANALLKLRLKEQAALGRTFRQKWKVETERKKQLEMALSRSEKHHAVLLAQSRQMQEHLRHLTHQVLDVQEEERRKISRELHDQIAQTLAGINVRLTTLKKEAQLNTKGLQGKIVHTQRLVEKSVKIVQRFARELRPALLDDLGLIPALKSFILAMTERTKMTIKFVTFPELEFLDVRKRTVFYRVVQEGLTNAVRHADAESAQVTFKKLRKSVLVEIQDNGKSFNVSQILYATSNKHLGVLGMRERVEMVGGTFRIESSKREGTHLWAEIPFLFPRPKVEAA